MLTEPKPPEKYDSNYTNRLITALQKVKDTNIDLQTDHEETLPKEPAAKRPKQSSKTATERTGGKNLARLTNSLKNSGSQPSLPNH